MTTDVKTLFADESIFVSEVDFSENVVPEPLGRRSVTWLPRTFVRAATTVVVGGMLTIAVGIFDVDVTNPVVSTRALKTAPWSKSPPIPTSVAAMAALKRTAFVHVPHTDIAHPDID